MTTSTPTPGMWLRVTPDGKAAPVAIKYRTFFLGRDPEWAWQSTDCIEGRVKRDPEGTIYYPITEEILKAAAAMADAIEREKMYDAEEARCNYLAAVEKAVKGA